jgi:sterol desaturase/sphingolipid hydroxylase (fatty acid hydroxylase superfamily)
MGSSQTTGAAALPRGNPKDSMKSTWRLDPSRWTLSHRLYNVLDILPVELGREVPVHSKQDKVPYVPDWQMNRWVIVHAAIPILIHHAYVTYTGQNIGPTAAFVFYSVAFKLIAIHEIRMLRELGHKYGYFDGDKHERDGVPDIGVDKVVRSLISTSTFRPLFTVFLSYRTSQAPVTISWMWLPLEVALYGVILDFWFYWYHRLMHDVPKLWQYHRTHHLTKHPNPLLTLYADTEQELFDIAGIPIMTYFTLRLLGLPMGFYDWWVCHQFVVFAELAGHSGLRVHATPPSTVSWLLRFFDAELIIEDHDLHHRTGWKKSHNYGKQTRLWDRIFGTCYERIEDLKDNVDYVNTVSMPLI